MVICAENVSDAVTRIMHFLLPVQEKNVYSFEKKGNVGIRFQEK